MKIILALLMTFTSIIAHSESEMLRLMRLSCESSKSARACYNYANLLHRRQKTQEARIYFKKGCQKGYGPSCNQITSEKLINATFVKAKKKKKSATKSLSKLEIAGIKELQNDENLRKLLTRYCSEKKLEEVCEMKRCMIDDPFSSTCKRTSLNDSLKQTGPVMKEMLTEITERDKEKIKDMDENKKFEYLLEESKKLSLKRLAKECDNGRLKSCFSYEYLEYMDEKMESQLAKIKEMTNKTGRSQASQN
jgi:hypothetical protein